MQHKETQILFKMLDGINLLTEKHVVTQSKKYLHKSNIIALISNVTRLVHKKNHMMGQRLTKTLQNSVVILL